MPDYKAMYYVLFNAVTDAIAALQAAQRQAEDIYIDGEEAPATEPGACQAKSDSHTG